MQKIRPGFILPSAAFTISQRQIRSLDHSDRPPCAGDLVYGTVTYVGEHGTLENKEGRIHMIGDGSRAVFVFGNRYAPDVFEGHVPDHLPREIDLLARSGIVGTMTSKNASRKDPTKIEILGYVADKDGKPLNTRDYPLIRPKKPVSAKPKRRAKMILHVGAAMNSGKSTSAIACCWALAAMGHTVRASKVTGTASLKDILNMQDAGAEIISDFSYQGHPSTYMLDEPEILTVFQDLDSKYANNPANFWVVEFADGIMQRETAMLLKNEYVRKRIHRLVFSASDAAGVVGGLNILKDEFDLVPHAISGRCSSSPLVRQELRGRTEIPIFDNLQRDLKTLSGILL